MQLLIKELQELRDEFNDFLYFLPDALLEIDIQNVRLSYMNRMAHILFGYSEDEFAQGIPVEQIFAEGEFEKAVEIIKSFVEENVNAKTSYERSGRQDLFEFLMKKKDGTTFHAETQTSFVLDDDGVPVGMRTLIRDVTERKLAEENRIRAKEADARAQAAEMHNQVLKQEIAERKIVEDKLRKSEAKYHALLNAMPDRIFSIRRDGLCFDWIKPRRHDARDRTVTAPPGKHIRDIMPGAVANRFMGFVLTALEEKQNQSFEYRWKSAGQLQTFEARLVVYDDDEVLVIVRDLSSAANKSRPFEFDVSLSDLELLRRSLLPDTSISN